MMKKLFAASIFVIFAFAVTQAQSVKRLYIANDDHTDYMWSGTVAQYDSAFVKMLDYHLAKIEATKNEPDNYQDRFNCDGSYWLRTYQKYRSLAQFNRLIAAIRSGHISSPLNSVVSTYGAQPAEAAIRGMYYAGQMERNYHLKFTLAAAMENNTVPLGLSAIWAGSGAKYSWKGVGGYGSQLSQESMKHRKYQLYRYTGMDGSSVITKWYAVNATLGGYAECRVITKAKRTDSVADVTSVINKLEAFCDTISPHSTYPYNVAGAFGFGHDDLQTFVSAPFTLAASAGTNAKRTVRVSNEEDFFNDIAKTYPDLPAQSVSYGNEWDLLPASMNETTAEVKRATEKLRAAEAMASVVALKEPAFADRLLPARSLAWDAFGLYWEHNWTADGPIGNRNRGLWQVKIKNDLCSYIDSLYDLAGRTLGKQLARATTPRFYVFNPLSWIRDDVADIPYTGGYTVKVIDLVIKKEVASQRITKNGQTFLRIAALQVPSVGYKIYQVKPGKALAAPQAAVYKRGYFSNAFYKIRLMPSGVITELYDKLNGDRQLVKLTGGRYLNDPGAADLNSGTITVENAGPVSVTLKAVSADPVLHTVRLTLYKNSRRIDIENSIDTNFTDNKTWAFSFNIHSQTTRHEELGSILTVKKITYGGNYADQNARYDWQTFNHFADMSNAQYGITLSNLDCSFFKLGKSTVDSLWAQSAQLNALAGGQIDIKKEDKGVLGIHRQLGQNHFHYHFSIIPHNGGFNAPAAMKASMEHQNPLTVGLITGNQGASAKPSFSLLSVSSPDVLLWSVKPAEEGIGNGLITRFWNIGNTPVSAVIKFYKPVTRLWRTSHIETNEQKLSDWKGKLKTDFAQQQLNTYRIGLQAGNQ